jgi:hypothetical protein
MAVLFEHVLKIPAHFWLNMQRSYDEYLAREERKELLADSANWARMFEQAIPGIWGFSVQYSRIRCIRPSTSRAWTGRCAKVSSISATMALM